MCPLLFIKFSINKVKKKKKTTQKASILHNITFNKKINKNNDRH